KRLASNYVAYRFDLNTRVLTDLGTFGGPTSEALGIDDLGRVVGSARNANYNTRPFLWTAHAGMRDLGSLGGPPSHLTPVPLLRPRRRHRDSRVRRARRRRAHRRLRTACIPLGWPHRHA